MTIDKLTFSLFFQPYSFISLYIFQFVSFYLNLKSKSLFMVIWKSDYRITSALLKDFAPNFQVQIDAISIKRNHSVLKSSQLNVKTSSNTANAWNIITSAKITEQNCFRKLQTAYLVKYFSYHLISEYRKIPKPIINYNYWY